MFLVQNYEGNPQGLAYFTLLKELKSKYKCCLFKFICFDKLIYIIHWTRFKEQPEWEIRYPKDPISTLKVWSSFQVNVLKQYKQGLRIADERYRAEIQALSMIWMAVNETLSKCVFSLQREIIMLMYWHLWKEDQGAASLKIE